MSDPVIVSEPVKKNSFRIWYEIIVNPFSGFQAVGEKTKIALPLICIMVLSVLSALLIQPIMSSPVYEKAMLEIQYAAIEKQQGTPLSDAMKETYRTQLTSSTTKMVTRISTLAVSPFSYMILLLISALVLKIFASLVKEKRKFGLFFRILAFAMIVTIAQVLIKNIITLTGDWAAALKSAEGTLEFGQALTSPVSLASLTSSRAIGKVGYYLLDTFTDIFNWLYYAFVYAGLTASAKIEKRKALILTLIFAATGTVMGFLAIAFI